MTFKKLMVNGSDSYPCWISGIYKIVSYRKRSFHAYFIQDTQTTWGDSVGTEPDRDPVTNNSCWCTLKAAKEACEQHAKEYTPKPAIVKRAAERLTEYREQAAENATA